MDLDISHEMDAFERNLRARGRSPVTIETYLRAVRDLRDYLHGEQTITKRVIEDYLNWSEDKGRSPVTRAKDYRSLQQFFKYMAEETGEPSPMTGLRPPHVTVTPPPVLTTDDLHALFATCKGATLQDRRDLAILSLFADTGMRRGEMAGIKLDDLDLREQVAVITGKTGTRAVPYGAETAARLDRYLRVRRLSKHAALPQLWIGQQGPVTVWGIENIIAKRAKTAGVAAHPHLFRHTFAHMWLDGGGNEGDLQRLAGWKSPLMLQRYGASAASARARRAYLAGRSPVDRMKP